MNCQYGLITCPKCKTSKIVELRYKTTKCNKCLKILEIKKIKIQYESNSLHDTQNVLGLINAEFEGNNEQFISFIKSSK
jgi:transcription initiation factor TFIIIB Brf1 subunit/transcription initiation factor TFIIB